LHSEILDICVICVCVLFAAFFSRSFVMAALRSRRGHYIFALWILLLSFFFPRPISAVAYWMATILPHGVALERI